MSRILLLKSDRAYAVSEDYIEEFAAQFRALGYDTTVVDMKIPGSFQQVCWLVENREVYAVADCQGIQTEIIPDVKYNQNMARVHFLCENPAYIDKYVKAFKQDDIIACSDRSYMRYLNRYYPDLEHICFFPLSGEQTGEYIPYEQREIDLLYVGDYEEAEPIAEGNEGDFAGKIRYEVWKQLAAAPARVFETTVEAVLRHCGIEVSDGEFIDILQELRDVESRVYQYQVNRTISTLLKAGIKVSVSGKGWERLHCKGCENLVILPREAGIAKRLIANARLVLNISPEIKDGVSEYMVTAMQCGTAVITETNPYIGEVFRDGNDLELYRMNRLEELPEQVERLLTNPSYAQALAENGCQTVRQHHTWADQVRAIAEKIEYHNGNRTLPHMGMGQEAEIEKEGMPDAEYIEAMATQFSDRLNRLNHLYNYDCAQMEDVLGFLLFWEACENKLKKRCGYTFLSGDNLHYLVQTLKEQAETSFELSKTLLQILLIADGMLMTLKERLRAAKTEELVLGQGRAKKNADLYNMILAKYFIQKYGDSEDADARAWVAEQTPDKKVNNYDTRLVSKYMDFKVDIRYDAGADMMYVMHGGKRLYYPRKFTMQEVYLIYRFTCLEQDEESPHRYVDEQFYVDEGSVLIDAGAAEGNFALDHIDRARKVYLVECEDMWVEALEKTFAPYMDKVEIIPKMLGNQVDENSTTIDEFAGDGPVDFIKMDVEGAEADALCGAEKTLQQNRHMKCVIATYHAKGMGERVRRYLESYNFQAAETSGYIYFEDEGRPIWEMELRHALVRAEK